MSAHPFVIVPSLTAIAVAYRQGNLIADRVLPRVRVDSETFLYNKYGLGDAFLTPETRVGRRSAPNQVDWSSSQVSATVEDHGLDTPIPNADMLAWQKGIASGAIAPGTPSPEERNTKLLMQAVQNRREYRAASLVFNAASYAAGNQSTLSGTSQWSDYANSDPLVAIKGWFDTMVMRPNVGTLGRLVATKLSMHPKVCKAFFGNNTDAGTVPIEGIAKMLELDELLVGDAYINIAAPGQAPNLVRAWGKHAAFTVRNQDADVTAGVTFGLTAQYGDQIAGSIQDPDVGLRGGQRVRAGESVKEIITANDLGYFAQNVIA